MGTTNHISSNSKRRVFLNAINKYRRKAMGLMTKNIGNSHTSKVSKRNIDHNIKKILIVRPNHRLGNMILTTPLLQEVNHTFPNCSIDVLSKGNLAFQVFKGYNIRSFMLLPRKPFNALLKYCLVWLQVRNRKYDLVINAVEGSSSGRLLTMFSRAKLKVYGKIQDVNSNNSSLSCHLAKNPICNLRDYLSVLGITSETNREFPLLSLNLAKNELEKGAQILKHIFNNKNKIICIFTHATGSKCYSEAWWDTLYAQLKSKYTEYNILEILPIENVSRIGFKASTLYTTDLREMASVIANSKLFIGADSGIMHLASASGTTTLGLFKKTCTRKYQPYGNDSLAINTNEKGIAGCLKAVHKMLNRDSLKTEHQMNKKVSAHEKIRTSTT